MYKSINHHNLFWRVCTVLSTHCVQCTEQASNTTCSVECVYSTVHWYSLLTKQAPQPVLKSVCTQCSDQASTTTCSEECVQYTGTVHVQTKQASQPLLKSVYSTLCTVCKVYGKTCCLLAGCPVCYTIVPPFFFSGGTPQQWTTQRQLFSSGVPNFDIVHTVATIQRLFSGPVPFSSGLPGCIRTSCVTKAPEADFLLRVALSSKKQQINHCLWYCSY